MRCFTSFPHFLLFQFVCKVFGKIEHVVAVDIGNDGRQLLLLAVDLYDVAESMGGEPYESEFTIDKEKKQGQK